MRVSLYLRLLRGARQQTCLTHPRRRSLSLFLSVLTTGWVSLGRPTSSPRTLTTGAGTQGPKRTALWGKDAGRCLSAPGRSSGFRQRIYMRINKSDRMFFARLCSSLGRGPGLLSWPAYFFGPGPCFNPSRYLTGWGACFHKILTSKIGRTLLTHYRTTTNYRKLSSYRRLYSDNVKMQLSAIKFLFQLTATIALQLNLKHVLLLR